MAPDKRFIIWPRTLEIVVVNKIRVLVPVRMEKIDADAFVHHEFQQLRRRTEAFKIANVSENTICMA